MHALTDHGAQVGDSQHDEDPSLRAGGVAGALLTAAGAVQHLPQEEHGTRYAEQRAHDTRREVDRVGDHHVFVVAERQADERGGVRAGHRSTSILSAAVRIYSTVVHSGGFPSITCARGKDGKGRTGRESGEKGQDIRHNQGSCAVLQLL